MENITLKNNQIILSGTITQPAVYSHSVYRTLNEKKIETKVCRAELASMRLSSILDYVPLVFNQKHADQFTVGKRILVRGEVRTINEEGSLKVFVYVHEISEPDPESEIDANEFEAIAYVCKAPNYRKTPQGKHITDLVLAINRMYRHSDYVPAIAWGNNAAVARGLPIGRKIHIVGRFQSRHYTKLIDEVTMQRTAYEVSIRDIHFFDDILK